MDQIETSPNEQHDDAPNRNPPRHPVVASMIFGGLMSLLAVLVVADAARLPDDTAAALGPAAVPLPVGVLLGLVGMGLLIRASAQLRSGTTGTGPGPGAWMRVLALVGTLVAFALLLPVVGYVISSTGLFTAAAMLLGAARPVPTLGYGLALSTTVFFVFDRLIGLTLPAGPWGF